ncbi:hypothetical protein GCM10010246_27620 [Streptomyces cuspidosporus]|uniref:Uncharacterized protein n=1 Tax=Streptomyces cuspidosporus TaxID=66882 RepID=A0ABP5T0M1_9ACTN|nr:hypothetical protein [Streptomyces sparsogenes]
MAALGGAGKRHDKRRRGPVRWMLALALGGVWWWAVLRLAAAPEQTGPVEGAFTAGGWGLSLLPVHCGPSPGRAVRRLWSGPGSRPGSPGHGDAAVRAQDLAGRER